MDTCTCGHVFGIGELRYRADDGRDYCNPCGTPIWLAEAAAYADAEAAFWQNA